MAFALLISLAPVTAGCANESASGNDEDTGPPPVDDDTTDADDDAIDNGVVHFPAGFQFGTATTGFFVDMSGPTLSLVLCTDANSD